jgi:hypothetical protein
VALIRTEVSEDRLASIFRVHECELVTERSCKLLYSCDTVHCFYKFFIYNVTNIIYILLTYIYIYIYILKNVI